MTPSLYLVLSLWLPYSEPDQAELKVEPGLYLFSCQAQVSAAPLVMTWSPEDGLGWAASAEAGLERKCK